jgi:hypothetical protein
MDEVVGDERRVRRQRAGELDRRGLEADLLLGLAQRRRRQIRVAGVAAAAGEGDLTRVQAQVGAALGEDQARLLGPAVDRQQDRRLGAAAVARRARVLGAQQQAGEVGQMITWTVPPSTDQAAPLT